MITENTKAILLLTSFFNSNEVKEFKTLTINEYGYFACWLHQNGYKPVDLLDEESFDSIWASWDEPLSHIKAKQIIDFVRLDNTIAKLTYDRVKNLLNRGASLSLALDKWQSAGVWIMDRQHEHYPKVIKKQLKHQSPALLFGVGNPELLSKQAIGFVGSRDCNSHDEEATNQYVEQINQSNYQVVSGAAKGVDTHAMLASLNNGNTAIGILADSLFRASASGQWRQHLKANNLVLISPFFPEGRFTPANAMARNKFIYILSSATVVVTSGEKGGTWEGAKENLKKDWVPLLVSAHQQPLQAGNQALINGSGLVKTKASALSISPTVSPQQFSELILNTNQSVQIHGERLNETGSLLSDPIASSRITDNTVEHSINNGSHINAQDDMFSMPGNIEQETLIPEPSVDVVITDETNEATETVQPKLVQTIDTAEREERTEQNQESFEPTSTFEISELQDLAPQQQSTTPLLDNFYQQLSRLIERQPQQIIDKTVIDSHFPEFELIGKTALSKWLKELVEQEKLIKAKSRKPQYTLPKQS
jgi:predicted Rossmann fold nucleotide-binding protein DprA/Smf involved in DNA uptake